MARSQYIWIVQDHEEEIVTGFTVKHELGSWLDKHGRDFLVSRVRDGSFGSGSAVRLNPKTLEPAA